MDRGYAFPSGCLASPGLVLVLLLASIQVHADTEIHRCLLEDGTTAFQETPCSTVAAKMQTENEPGGRPEPPEREAEDAVMPAADSQNEAAAAPPAGSAPAPTRIPETPHRDRAACEKASRDAIDAIDAEMRETAYSSEQGREYLAELLVLTRQLRACKQLPVLP